MSSVILSGAAEAPLNLSEPSLDEILADPLVGLILRRDGLTPGVVRVKLDRERQRLARSGHALPRAA
ncbi:hypothetical protein [Ancylobacter defluvii]|uniref:Uncharacterized protein n=1 Tax=Ancylobacter defluvii TaxID=1282440 RepID=A0A9W6NAS4_9HYPH|nr:hypothetical protein [Ancylobacter defluvii]MBS7589207.1 hypothetical protein [Ancylobacter defluvii]GLK84819.1 hypothetical protein GCM10017653_28890 [Ancylobacter defluvii]